MSGAKAAPELVFVSGGEGGIGGDLGFLGFEG